MFRKYAYFFLRKFDLKIDNTLVFVWSYGQLAWNLDTIY